jgi:glycosyltransferase involved in cell wall biosynthesis
VSTLRIGLFTEVYRPIKNGIVASVDALANAIRARGHEVVCVAPSVPNYREDRDDVVRIPSLPLPTRTAYRLAIPLLRHDFERTLGDLSIVHTHSPFVTGWMGARLARRLRVPLVFTYHTQLEKYAHYFPFESRMTRGAAAHLTRSYADSADAVIVPTAAMEAHLRALGVRSRIEIVPSGIDLAFFAGGRWRGDLRASLGVPDDGKMVLSVGRLGREKNLELTLEAFARVRTAGAHLVVIGEGLHRSALQRLARRLGIAGRTTFAGEFERAELPDVYASADALAFTSGSETQGLVLVEALAAGLPVVAVDTPQTRDVLGASGLIVPPDPVGLAAAIEATLVRILPRSPPAQTLAARFDEQALGSRILGLYADLAAAPVEAAG